MFYSDIDINCCYFYMSFGPTTLSYKDCGLIKTLDPNIFIDRDKNKWRKCKLYDTGWGVPNGFERIPELKFSELIKIALLSDYKTTKISIQNEEANKYGAIAIILDRHIDEMILFLNDNIKNPLLCTEPIKNNLLLFCDKNNAKTPKCKIVANLINTIYNERPL